MYIKKEKRGTSWKLKAEGKNRNRDIEWGKQSGKIDEKKIEIKFKTKKNEVRVPNKEKRSICKKNKLWSVFNC